MKKALFYLLFGIAGFANAQYNPEIFTDLYTGTNSFNGILNLRFSTKMNNQLFFNLQKELNYDLYVTDGSVANTIVLKEVTQILNLVTFDNHVYFSFRDDNNGVELWKTDGTLGGTVLVSNLGGQGISAHNYVVAGNKLYFASGNSASPFLNQLFSLDAGSNTPVLLNSNLKDVESITKYNDKVIFHGTELDATFITRELYISDGTQSGTFLLKDIKPGEDGSDPNDFFLFQNRLYFSADDGSNGKEIWVTDGTNAGTTLFKDISPGSGNGITYFYPGVYNNKMYFSAMGAMWSSDGTVSGTNLFMSLNTDTGKNFVTLNNKLVFLANDGTHGFEFWTSDGTPQNTNLLVDANPGTGSISFSLLQSNAICTDQLFFDGDNGGFNFEPWVTDGTAAGTHIIEDLNPSEGSSQFGETHFVYFDDRIFFAANSGMGRELFVMAACANLGLETNNATNFTVYPNPAKNIISIETTSEISKVEIYNTLGQLVNTVAGNKQEIDVSGLSKGIYFLTITTSDNYKSVQRIIKE